MPNLANAQKTCFDNDNIYLTTRLSNAIIRLNKMKLLFLELTPIKTLGRNKKDWSKKNLKRKKGKNCWITHFSFDIQW